MRFFCNLMMGLIAVMLPFKTQAQCLADTEVNRLLKKVRTKFNVPAVAMVVMNSDSILFSRVEGVRVRGASEAATINDFFHIGSTAKSILAVLAGRFVEKGLLK